MVVKIVTIADVPTKVNVFIKACVRWIVVSGAITIYSKKMEDSHN